MYKPMKPIVRDKFQ